MKTTREAFRRAIDHGAPTGREARDDLDAVLARVDRSKRPLVVRLVPVVSGAGFAAAAAAAIALHASSPPGVAAPHPHETTTAPDRSTPPPEAREVSLYIRRSGDPEDKALSLTLNPRGDIR